MTFTSEADDRDHPIGAELLFRSHGRFVASFLRHMSVLESDLDDHVQDVFVLAHRKGGYQPGLTRPRTWLASLAIRVVTTRRRATARQQRQALADPESVRDDARGPDELLESKRSLQRVQAALAHLSLEQRATFVLFELEGVPCEQIAEMWHVPVGTVYSRLHHARKRFVKSYERGNRG